MLPGNLLLILYKETKQEKYKLAAESIRRVFDYLPRTKTELSGMPTRRAVQWQLWADGVFMSLPFLVSLRSDVRRKQINERGSDEADPDLLQAL